MWWNHCRLRPLWIKKWLIFLEESSSGLHSVFALARYTSNFIANLLFASYARTNVTVQTCSADCFSRLKSSSRLVFCLPVSPMYWVSKLFLSCLPTQSLLLYVYSQLTSTSSTNPVPTWIQSNALWQQRWSSVSYCMQRRQLLWWSMTLSWLHIWLTELLCMRENLPSIVWPILPKACWQGWICFFR